MILRLIHTLYSLIQGSIFVGSTSAHHVPKPESWDRTRIDAPPNFAFGHQTTQGRRTLIFTKRKKINIHSVWLFNDPLNENSHFFPQMFLVLFPLFRSSKAQDKLSTFIFCCCCLFYPSWRLNPRLTHAMQTSVPPNELNP